MYNKSAKWDKNDFGQAMVNAVYQHAQHKYIKHIGSKLTFNGFWRNGKKSNVCIWPDQATWSDLNSNENINSNKGGVKSFAKAIFNMELTDFMSQYGNTFQKPFPLIKPIKTISKDYINNIWNNLLNRDRNRPNHAGDWLINTRKLGKPNILTNLEYANLYQDDVNLFVTEHQKLIQHRVTLGRNIIVPLRGIENAQAQNLFIRIIDDVTKENKSRFLTGCGGLIDEKNTPKAFGYPHLIYHYPNLVICEGMADYFAVECLLDTDEKYLPLGAPGTAALTKWATWLSQNNYHGNVYIIYQLDIDQNGSLTDYGPGQKAAVNAKKILSNAGVSTYLFNWSSFLRQISNWYKPPHDLADIFVCSNSSHDQLSKVFHITLKNHG